MFRMGGAIPLLPQYFFMAWTGTALLWSRHGFSCPVTGMRRRLEDNIKMDFWRR
jgi:hypothetical protein